MLAHEEDETAAGHTEANEEDEMDSGTAIGAYIDFIEWS